VTPDLVTDSIQAFQNGRLKKYGQEVLPALNDLFLARNRSSRSMLDLVSEYRDFAGATRLALYAKPGPVPGLPRALHWGHIESVVCGITPTGDFERKTVPVHIADGLTDAHIVKYAADHRRSADYFAFDRRRLALNAAHRNAAETIAHVLRILVPNYKNAPDSSESAELLVVFVPELSTTDAEAALRLASRLVVHLVEAEARLFTLVSSYRDRPLDPRLSLVFTPDPEAERTVFGWRDDVGELVVEGLTRRYLASVGVPVAGHRDLFCVDRQARTFFRDFTRHANAFLRIRGRLSSALSTCRGYLNTVG
jgi:hypothetical protein